MRVERGGAWQRRTRSVRRTRVGVGTRKSMIERKPFVHTHTAHIHAPHALGPVMFRSAFGGSSAFATDAKAAVTIASMRDGSFSFAAASRFAA